MASNSHDATIDGPLRSGLIHMSAGEQSCPGPDVIAAYYEHSLDAKDAARIETHLSRCGRCRQHLALLVRTEEVSALAARHGFWLWDWRFLTPAIAALLIFTVWGLRRSSLRPVNHQQAEPPLVAMSRAPEQARSNTPLPEPPATPPNGSQPTLITPQSLDRVAPKAKSELQLEAPKLDKQLQPPQSGDSSLPLNGRNFKDLQTLVPTPQVGQKRDEATELKKDALNEAAPAPVPSPSAIAPQAMSAARAPESPQALATRQNAARAADNMTAGAIADEAAKAPNVTSEGKEKPGLKTFATANAVAGVAGAMAQPSVQRSGSTILQTPDPKILWRLAGGSFVERTKNAGASWQGAVAYPDAQLTAGSAPTNKVCWLVGKAGMILVTRDAQHWKKLPPPVPADFVAVDAQSHSAATVTAAGGQKFSTANEGKKWLPAK